MVLNVTYLARASSRDMPSPAHVPPCIVPKLQLSSLPGPVEIGLTKSDKHLGKSFAKEGKCYAIPVGIYGDIL